MRALCLWKPCKLSSIFLWQIFTLWPLGNIRNFWKFSFFCVNSKKLAKKPKKFKFFWKPQNWKKEEEKKA